MRRQRIRPTRDETRARLLVAAERVFVRRGFHAATVDEIASEAGFTTGALYSNFDGKQDLFVALFEQHMERRLRDVQAIEEEADDVPGQAGARLELFLEQERAWPLLFYEFWGLAVRDPKVRRRWRRGRRRFHDAMGESIQRLAAHRGYALPVAADQLAIAINALANGLVTERMADPAAVADDTFPITLDVFLAGLEVRR